MIVKSIFTGETYDLDKLAACLRGKGIEASPEYESAVDGLVEQTMSCDREEAVHYLVGMARRAVSSATGSRNDSLRVDFLSAYDLAKKLNSRAFA